MKLRDISLVFEYMNRDDVPAAFVATTSRFTSYLYGPDPLIASLVRLKSLLLDVC
jgi:hypothetical protein